LLSLIVYHLQSIGILLLKLLLSITYSIFRELDKPILCSRSLNKLDFQRIHRLPSHYCHLFHDNLLMEPGFDNILVLHTSLNSPPFKNDISHVIEITSFQKCYFNRSTGIGRAFIALE